MGRAGHDRPAVGRCRRARGHRHVPPHRRRARPPAGGRRSPTPWPRPSPATTSCWTRPSRPTAASDPSSRARATASSPPSPVPPTPCSAALDAQRALQAEAWPTAVAAQGAHGDPHRRDPAPRRGQLRRRHRSCGRRGCAPSPTAGRCWCRRPRTTSWWTSCPPRRARRPRHPPAQGPRPARARVAARPPGARVGVPAAGVARQRPEQPPRLPVDVHRSLRRDRHRRPPRARQPARHPHGSGRRRQDPPGPAGRRRARRDLPRRRVVGRPRRRAGPGRCSPSAISRAALLAEDRDDRLGGVARRLAGQRALLILDNCEHLADACAEVAAEILRGCPEVAVLATSRAAAERAGRAELAGAAARAPAGRGRVARRRPRTATPSACSSIARPEPDATSASRDENVGGRRRHLLPAGRHPAGHRAGRRSLPGAVAGPAPRRARRLARACSASGPRTVDERHQTIERSIEWSHSMLSDATRVVFRRLGVFASPVHAGGRPVGGGGRRGRAARGGRRARAPHRPVARADGRPRRASRASACSRRFASSLAGRSTPPGRPTAIAARHADLLPDAGAGPLAALPRWSGGAPRHGRRRVRGPGGDARPPRAPRHAGGARRGGHGLPARHRRAARRRGGRARRAPSPPGWSRPACSAGTSTCGSPWPTRRCRTTCRSRWRPPRRPTIPSSAPSRPTGGPGGRRGRRRAETRWRPTSGLASPSGTPARTTSPGPTGPSAPSTAGWAATRRPSSTRGGPSRRRRACGATSWSGPRRRCSPSPGVTSAPPTPPSSGPRRSPSRCATPASARTSASARWRWPPTPARRGRPPRSRPSGRPTRRRATRWSSATSPRPGPSAASSTDRMDGFIEDVPEAFVHLDDMWSKRSDARLRLAAAHHALGDLERAGEVVAELQEMARALGRRSRAARARSPTAPPRSPSTEDDVAAADDLAHRALAEAASGPWPPIVVDGARAAGVGRGRPREPRRGGPPRRRRGAPARRDRLPLRARAGAVTPGSRPRHRPRRARRRRLRRGRRERPPPHHRRRHRLRPARPRRAQAPVARMGRPHPDGAPGRRPRHRAGSPTPRSPSSSSSAARPSRPTSPTPTPRSAWRTGPSSSPTPRGAGSPEPQPHEQGATDDHH